MKKILFSMLVFVSLIVLLTACGSNAVADEAKIRSDLEAYTKTDFLAKNEKIIEINVDKRQTEKDDKLDTVWCTVKTEDNRRAYEKSLVLTYTLYDEGGWILDKVTVNKRSEWNITPLTGVSDDEITASLNAINVTAGNESWSVTQDKIKNISIDKHETDLAAKKDIVTATLTIDDIVEEAKGQLVINYSFVNGVWKMDSMVGNEGFTVAMKQGMDLSATDELLLNALDDRTFEYGLAEGDIFWDKNDLQTISVKKSEVSDFKIENHEAYEKGTTQAYTCSGTLKKPHAEFSLKIEIRYHYSGEWILQPVSITAKCISATVDGTWTGTYTSAPFSGTCKLEITEIGADGTINAIYSYNPEVTNDFSESGSYYVSGKIDLTTLMLTLKAGDWIDHPKWDALVKSDIIARLYVDDSTLSGRAQHGNGFIVSQ